MFSYETCTAVMEIKHYFVCDDTFTVSFSLSFNYVVLTTYSLLLLCLKEKKEIL